MHQWAPCDHVQKSFVTALKQIQRGLFHPNKSHWETYDSDAGEGEVWVRLDRSGELELARTAGFAPQFEFQFGDEIGVQVLDGVAQTIPTVKHTIVHEDRVEFWAVNRATGRFRLLASNSYE